jgi:hypothetical protein
MQDKKQLTSIVLFIVVFGFGFWGGYLFGYGKGVNPVMKEAQENRDDTFEAGWQAAQERIKEAQVIAQPEAVYSLSGTITDLGRTSLTMTSSYQSRNPLDRPAPEERIVKITRETEFYIEREKSADDYRADQKTYAAALEAYKETLNDGDHSAQPPRPVLRTTQIPATIEQLAEGATIRVEQKSENLAYAAEFDAAIIYIIE